MSNIPEEAKLRDEEIRGHFYKVSTSPERFAFTKDDGTLIDPSRHSFVDTKRLADAASEKAFPLGVEKGRKDGMESVFDVVSAAEMLGHNRIYVAFDVEYLKSIGHWPVVLNRGALKAKP